MSAECVDFCRWWVLMAQQQCTSLCNHCARTLVWESIVWQALPCTLMILLGALISNTASVATWRFALTIAGCWLLTSTLVTACIVTNKFMLTVESTEALCRCVTWYRGGSRPTSVTVRALIANWSIRPSGWLTRTGNCCVDDYRRLSCGLFKCVVVPIYSGV